MGKELALRKPRWHERVATVWVGLVALLLSWQIAADEGLPAYAAEWQYDKLGYYHPAITFLLLLLLLCLPVLIWNRALKPKTVRDAEETDAARLNRALVWAVNLRKGVASLSLITAFCALLIGIYTLLLPCAGSDFKNVVITGTELAPAVGPTQLRGKILLNKIALLHRGLLGKNQVDRFAPMIYPESSQSRFRFFVELPPQAATAGGSAANSQIGFLRKGGLPDGLADVYRSAGFTVDRDYYVLFPSSAAMRRPYLIDMAEFLLTSLMFSALALLAAYQVRRLKVAQSMKVV